MLKIKSWEVFCGVVAVFILSGCSSKVLPQGQRVSVLEQETAIKAEVADGAAQIQIPSAVPNSAWRQTDVSAQHVIPNVQTGARFVRAWKTDFGKGSSKHEFLISQPLISGERVYTLDAFNKININAD